MCFRICDFNPRAPCGARRHGRLGTVWRVEISIHAPLAGRDLDNSTQFEGQPVISIHAPLAGRDSTVIACAVPFLYISIHAPLAGRDHEVAGSGSVAGISIHAPLAGRDSGSWRPRSSRMLFQSTRPLRGATTTGAKFTITDKEFQSTRPLRGATPPPPIYG